MKMRQVIFLLLPVVVLGGCAAAPQRKAPAPMSARPPFAGGPTTTAEAQPPLSDTSIDLSTESKPSGSTKSDTTQKPVLPRLSGKPQTGLLSPLSQDHQADRAPLPGSEKQRVVLNFEKADISEVTNQIFGDYLKLNYVLDPALQGRISLYLEGEYTKEQLFQMVTRAYEANNVSIVPRKGIYYIQPLQRSSSSSLPVANAFTLQDDKSGSRPLIVIYRLQYADVKQAINTIRFFLSPGRPVAADNLTNSIIFVENAENARTIVDVLKALDINLLQEVSMEIVPLQSVAPQDAVQSVEALMGKLNLLKDSPIRNNLAFIPLQNFGGVLVLAQNPELLKTAKYWLTALDVQGQESGEQINVYFVQNSLARDIADILNQTYGLRGTSTGRLEQQVVQSTGSSFGGTSSTGRTFGSPSSTGTGSAFGSSSTRRSFGSSGTTGQTLGSGTSAGGLSGGTGGSTQRRTGATGAGTGRFTAQGASVAPSLSGEVMVIPDEVNNAIVIRANTADYAKLRKTIETLDILPRSVLIEVMIAEITLTKDLEYGVEWFFKEVGMNIGGEEGQFSGSLGAGRNNRFSPRFNVGNISNGLSLFWGTVDKDIGALINLLDEKTEINVLSTPTLLATDNIEASITVGGREPVSTGQTTSDAGTTSAIQYEETGIILNVTPHINAGGLVRLEVEQTIRNVAEEGVRVGNTTSPRFSERNVKTSLITQNRSTVVIGGIIEQRQNRRKAGIPVLGDIPIISPLFSGNTIRNDRTELIIAITPHVVSHGSNCETQEFVEKLRDLQRRIQQ